MMTKLAFGAAFAFLLSLGGMATPAAAQQELYDRPCQVMGWRQSTAEFVMPEHGSLFVNFPPLTGVYFLVGFVHGAPIVDTRVWAIEPGQTKVLVQGFPGEVVRVVFCRRSY